MAKCARVLAVKLYAWVRTKLGRENHGLLGRSLYVNNFEHAHNCPHLKKKKVNYFFSSENLTYSYNQKFMSNAVFSESNKLIVGP